MPFPPLPVPDSISESYLPSHDLTYHILQAGNPSHPLVLCLHGFPELAFSWRKIMPAIAAQGYHVVAYDQRGYGRTTGWDAREYAAVDLNSFAFTRLVRDALIVVNALGHKEVTCLLSHDFGAVAASMCAMMRPDFFKAVVLMSHPFAGAPTLPFNTIANPAPPEKKEDVSETLAELPEPRKPYKWYYASEPAAAEMDNPQADLPDFLRGYFYLKSADWQGNDPKPLKAWTATELAKMPYYYVMPLHAGMRESVRLGVGDESMAAVAQKMASWLPEDDLAIYVDEWKRNGFQGGLNWYRVLTDPNNMKDVELFAGRTIDVPCMFISGKQDWGTYQQPGAIEKMDRVCSQFRGAHLLDGAGHWVQQEQADAVIGLVATFLRETRSERTSSATV